MIERMSCDVAGDAGLHGAPFRYRVLERLGSLSAAHGVTLLAWGFAQGQLRMVLEGDRIPVNRVVKGLRIGTARWAESLGLSITLAPVVRWTVEDADLAEAVAWVHRAPVEESGADPLESPWSSHRDLLAFRSAAFYRADVLEGRVDPREVHRLAGGVELPDGWPPPIAKRRSLGFLLRLAGAVLGVLPADRRCFRLFVHLARDGGFASVDMASALYVTPRRVRQLAAEDEPNLGLALRVMASSALCVVP